MAAKKIKKATKRVTKADFFRAYGVELKKDHIQAPWGEWVPLPLTWGSKTLCFGFSTLAGTKTWEAVFNGDSIRISGTCKCQCEHCYGCSGRYVMPSVIKSNTWRTVAARVYQEWLEKTIVAQINWGKNGHPLKCVRVHITGDFFSPEYIALWRRIISACPDTEFWTYTKNPDAENAFDDIDNMNVVKSIIPGYGFNFGRAGYVINLYKELTAAGIPTHICRCGIDKNQHCDSCGACRKLGRVLFLEHGSDYKPKKDPDFAEFCRICDSPENTALM